MKRPGFGGYLGYQRRMQERAMAESASIMYTFELIDELEANGAFDNDYDKDTSYLPKSLKDFDKAVLETSVDIVPPGYYF